MVFTDDTNEETLRKLRTSTHIQKWTIIMTNKYLLVWESAIV